MKIYFLCIFIIKLKALDLSIVLKQIKTIICSLNFNIFLKDIKFKKF